MSSLTPQPLPQSPHGLPASPRANRQMALLTPLDTSIPTSPSPYSGSTEGSSSPASTLVAPPPTSTARHHRNADSLIFINATIPLSPASSTHSSLHKHSSPYDGLAPRKRSGFARFFSCLGREERSRRRVARETEFVKVGEDVHWTEY